MSTYAKFLIILSILAAVSALNVRACNAQTPRHIYDFWSIAFIVAVIFDAVVAMLWAAVG